MRKTIVSKLDELPYTNTWGSFYFLFFCLCIPYFRLIVLRPFRFVYGDRPQCHRNGRTIRIDRRTLPGRCTENAQHDRTTSIPRFEMMTTRFVGLWAVFVLSSVAKSAPEQQKQERPVRLTFGRDSGEKRDNHRHTAFLRPCIARNPRTAARTTKVLLFAGVLLPTTRNPAVSGRTTKFSILK